MLMTYHTFKQTLPKPYGWKIVRVLTYLIAAPVAFSLAYAVMMLGISMMWWVGQLVGDDGQLLPYSCSALSFLIIAAIAESMVKRKHYRGYLAIAAKSQLLEIVESPKGVYRGWEVRMAINVLHEKEMNHVGQP